MWSESANRFVRLIQSQRESGVSAEVGRKHEGLVSVCGDGWCRSTQKCGTRLYLISYQNTSQQQYWLSEESRSPIGLVRRAGIRSVLSSLYDSGETWCNTLYGGTACIGTAVRFGAFSVSFGMCTRTD